MPKPEWDIPVKLQPDPADYSFDLDRTLNAVVGLRAIIPPDAFTAGSLGTERTGSGVVIRDDGLVLTIGYLITEAEQVWLSCADGRVVAAHPLGFDYASGLGLVQPLGRLDLPALKLGRSAEMELGQPAIFASCGGRRHAVATKLVARQEFAGYWEYLLDEALFTAPAHPFWGGAALIGGDGQLLGIGSLILQQGDGQGRRVDMNMAVPVDVLPPVFDALLSGRPARPAQPWLGLYATETDDGVVVEGVVDKGPAEQAGLREGDRILAIEAEEVQELADLWRRLWAAGPPGTRLRLQIGRDDAEQTISIVSADRTALLKAPRLH